MFNLVLLDDEEFIIRSLSHILNWEKCGFKVIATFTNPVRAMEYVKSNHVDAIILDISMPLMNGIEFIKQLNKFKPDIKKVLLSAHSDFEYARQAIEYGAFLYILKPISVSRMEEIASKLYSELEKEKNKQHGQLYIDSISIRKSINAYMHENISDAEFLSEVAAFGIDSNTKFMNVKLKLADLEHYLANIFSYGIERLYNAVCQLLNKKKFNFILLKTNIDEMQLLFYGNMNLGEFVDGVFEECNNLLSNAFECLNLYITIQYNGIIKDYTKFKLNPDVKLAETAAMLMTSTSASSKKKIAENNKSILMMAKKAPSTELFYYDFIERVVIAYLNRTTVNEIEELFLNALNSLPKDICEFENLISEFNMFFTVEQENAQTHELIDFVKSYIDSHYSESITLSSIAEQVGRNSSYLSRCFKNKTGEKLISYLNNVRIQKAMEMLANSDKKISVIANEVGFNDVNNFHRVFKERMGISPQQFRKNLNNDLQSIQHSIDDCAIKEGE